MQFIPTMFFGAQDWDKEIDFLLVGGGGTGNNGGGGAGGFVTGSATLLTGSFYTYQVGMGGIYDNIRSGSTSYFLGTASYGGGAGGSTALTEDGASGGGADFPTTIPGYNNNYGLGIVGQGNRGGRGARNIIGTSAAGGGGGANSAGGDAQYFGDQQPTAGNGGNGKTWFDGITYAGGGGGRISSGPSSATGSGGSGGGGDAEQNGVDELGGGAGGNGEFGGDGIFKLRYKGSKQRIIGGSISRAGGYTYHKFTTSGSFYVIQEDDINRDNKYQLEYLLVGAGGGGGSWFTGSVGNEAGGGGGGGAAITGSLFATSSFTIDVQSIGSQGLGGRISPSRQATNGGDTIVSCSLFYHTAEGGGAGGFGTGSYRNGVNGGNGGGGGTGFSGPNGTGGTGSLYGNKSLYNQ